MPRGKDRCISDTALEINLITITWKRGHWHELFGNTKTKTLTNFSYFEDIQNILFLMTSRPVSCSQILGQLSCLGVIQEGHFWVTSDSQIALDDCITPRKPSSVWSHSINPEPTMNPRHCKWGKEKNFLGPFQTLQWGNCRKGSTYFQMEKPLMRAESGPGTWMDQNQAEWHQSRRLIAVSEKPARLCHEIRNTWSISEPLGDSKPLQATDESKKNGMSVERTVWQSLHRMLALRWTQRTPERDTNTCTGYSAAPQEAECGSGAEENKKSCVLVPETSYVQAQKRETEVNENAEDHPLSPRVHG